MRSREREKMVSAVCNRTFLLVKSPKRHLENSPEYKYELKVTFSIVYYLYNLDPFLIFCPRGFLLYGESILHYTLSRKLVFVYRVNTDLKGATETDIPRRITL